MTRIPFDEKTAAEFAKSGTAHANVVLNDTHRASTGIDHSEVVRLEQLGKTRTAQLVWDFAVDGGATGAISMLDSDGVVFSLPDNSIITKAYYEVITTFTSPTADIASVSLGHADDAAGIFAATTITAATDWDAAIPKACIQTGVISTASLKTTAARPILFTIAVEAITAGKMHLFLEYVTTE